MLLIAICCLAPQIACAESQLPVVLFSELTNISLDAATQAALTQQSNLPVSPQKKTVNTVNDSDRVLTDQYDVEKIARYYGKKFRQNSNYVLKIVNQAIASGKEYNVNPFIILAIIAHESHFQRTARNRSGATGLMQISLRVHKKRFERYGGIQMIYNPEMNIKVGTTILSECIILTKTTRNGLHCFAGSKDSIFVDFVLREAAMLKGMASLPARKVSH